MRKFTVILLLSIMLAACAGKDEIDPNLTEAELYEKASVNMEKGRYDTSVEYYQALEARYPFGSYSDQAQLDIIYAYYMGSEHEAAGAAADRFIRLEFYEIAEMIQIIERAASILEVELLDAAAGEIAKRARLTPRIANRLLKRVRDYVQVEADGRVSSELALSAIKLLEIDHLGLDYADRRILTAIIESYSGGPVGLGTLAALTAEEETTIEDFYEPYLMQLGFLERTPRGRRVTVKAYKHMDIQPPKSTEPTD